MTTRIGFGLLLSVAICLLFATWTVTHVDARTNAPAVRGAVESATLAECARPDVVLGTALKASPVDRAAAQRASGVIGVRGDPAIAVLTTVTLGTRTGSVATAAEALVDGRGAPIVERPAWVFVFRNQAVRAPSGGGYIPGVPRVSPRLQSVLASVVDAQTGQFLRGWGCAFAN
jgi:hypothetical protein